MSQNKVSGLQSPFGDIVRGKERRGAQAVRTKSKCVRRVLSIKHLAHLRVALHRHLRHLRVGLRYEDTRQNHTRSVVKHGCGAERPTVKSNRRGREHTCAGL